MTPSAFSGFTENLFVMSFDQCAIIMSKVISLINSLFRPLNSDAVQNASECKVEMLRFYRPDDISQQEAYQADYWDVYASSEKLMVSVSDIVSKCSVSLPNIAGEDVEEGSAGHFSGKQDMHFDCI